MRDIGRETNIFSLVPLDPTPWNSSTGSCITTNASSMYLFCTGISLCDKFPKLFLQHLPLPDFPLLQTLEMPLLCHTSIFLPMKNILNSKYVTSRKKFERLRVFFQLLVLFFSSLIYHLLPTCSLPLRL